MGAEPSKPSNGTGIRPGTVNGSNDSSGINRIDRHVQQRFVRGVHYNLKIIIRGKRNVGKSTLFRRLKGQVYQPEYVPTPEIQTATINWSHQGDDPSETVKVEVWDVIDRGIQPSGAPAIIGSVVGVSDIINEQMKKGSSISSGEYKVSVLDASMVDVYQDASAVIFVVSPLDEESVEYVRQNYQKVPYEIPILLLQNYRDKLSPPSSESNAAEKSSDTELSPEEMLAIQSKMNITMNELMVEMQQYRRDIREKICFEPLSEYSSIESSNSHGNAGHFQTFYSLPSLLTEDIHFMEVSMLNCYGLQELYKYLSIPFLRLKQRVLEERLHRGRQQLEEAEATIQKLVQENTYSVYLKKYEQIQREKLRQKQLQQQQQEELQAAILQAQTQAQDDVLSSQDMSQTIDDSEDEDDIPVRQTIQNKSKLESNASRQDRLDSSDDSDALPSSKTLKSLAKPSRIRRKVNPTIKEQTSVNSNDSSPERVKGRKGTKTSSASESDNDGQRTEDVAEDNANGSKAVENNASNKFLMSHPISPSISPSHSYDDSITFTLSTEIEKEFFDDHEGERIKHHDKANARNSNNSRTKIISKDVPKTEEKVTVKSSLKKVSLKKTMPRDQSKDDEEAGKSRETSKSYSAMAKDEVKVDSDQEDAMGPTAKTSRSMKSLSRGGRPVQSRIDEDDASDKNNQGMKESMNKEASIDEEENDMSPKKLIKSLRKIKKTTPSTSQPSMPIHESISTESYSGIPHAESVVSTNEIPSSVSIQETIETHDSTANDIMTVVKDDSNELSAADANPSEVDHRMETHDDDDDGHGVTSNDIHAAAAELMNDNDEPSYDGTSNDNPISSEHRDDTNDSNYDRDEEDMTHPRHHSSDAILQTSMHLSIDTNDDSSTEPDTSPRINSISDDGSSSQEPPPVIVSPLQTTRIFRASPSSSRPGTVSPGALFDGKAKQSNFSRPGTANNSRGPSPGIGSRVSVPDPSIASSSMTGSSQTSKLSTQRRKRTSQMNKPPLPKDMDSDDDIPAVQMATKQLPPRPSHAKSQYDLNAETLDDSFFDDNNEDEDEKPVDIAKSSERVSSTAVEGSKGNKDPEKSQSGLSAEAQRAIQAAMQSWMSSETEQEPHSKPHKTKKKSKSKDYELQDDLTASDAVGKEETKKKSKSKAEKVKAKKSVSAYDYDSETEL